MKKWSLKISAGKTKTALFTTKKNHAGFIPHLVVNNSSIEYRQYFNKFITLYIAWTKILIVVASGNTLNKSQGHKGFDCV